MFLPLFLLAVMCLALAFAFVVRRADPDRWDNRIFALMVTLDGVTAGAKSALLFGGHRIVDPLSQRITGASGFLITYVTMEFAYSFPFDEKLPGRYRALLATWTLGLGSLFVISGGGSWFTPACTYGYFVPALVLTMALLVRNYRRIAPPVERGPVRLVMLVLSFRWLIAQVVYDVARPLGLRYFEIASLFEATVATLVSFLVVGYAILSSRLFRVRGIVAEVVIYAGFALAVVVATGALVDVELRSEMGPTLLRAAIVATSLVPVAFVWIAIRLRNRVETLLLPLDPRRALRIAILERVLGCADSGADADGFLKLVQNALAEVSLGGAAHFVAAPGRRALRNEPTMPKALADWLSRAGVESVVPASALKIPSDVAADLARIPGDLFVPVKTRDTLFGALVLTGGQLDRDTVLTATSLVKHLAVTLQNQSLYTELEGARRLATLGSFAAAIAHDIRTPLASIQMNVQILRGKVDLEPDDMEHFDIALDELKRLNVHISELLDYAKPVKLDEAPLDLREVADEAARAIETASGDAHVEVETSHEDALPNVSGDGLRLRQVLLNLLDNAAKASPGAKVLLRTRAVDDGRVALEVSDTGRGIKADDLPHIFEPFFTTRADGTGLGLAIVQKLVLAHRGEVVVESAPGVGSTFTILLPAAAGGNET